MIVNICCIAQNEELYIEDWLLYHFKIGVDNITIYDNNSIEKKDVLTDLIKNSQKVQKYIDRIEIVHCNGYKTYQIPSYMSYYRSHVFDWVINIDIDEFIVLRKWKNIKDMLSDTIFDNAEVVLLNWRTIGDDDVICCPDNYVYNGVKFCDIIDEETRLKAINKYLKIPIYNRLFQESKKCKRNYYKSIIRSNIKSIETIRDHGIRKIRNLPVLSVNVRGEITNIFSDNGSLNLAEHCSEAYLNHYRTKTLYEYLMQKFLRTTTESGNNNHQNLLKYFFEFNNKNAKKIKFFNDFVRDKNIKKRIYVFNQNATLKDILKHSFDYKFIFNDKFKSYDNYIYKDNFFKMIQEFDEIVFL